MSRRFALALSLLLPVAAAALDVPAERERLKAERAAVDARFAEAEKACWQKFAVNDCVKAARNQRDARLAEIRRQELTLSDEERRRRAAERQQEVDERNSPERRAADEKRRQDAVQERRLREAEAAEKAAKRQAQQEERSRKAAARPQAPASAMAVPPPATRAAVPQQRLEGGSLKSDRPSPQEAAKNRADYEARLREAAERRARLHQRLTEKRKQPASDLPVPP